MNMVTKNMIKLAHSLELKKNRKRERLFIAEGPKTVGDMIRHYTVHAIFALEEWRDKTWTSGLPADGLTTR